MRHASFLILVCLALTACLPKASPAPGLQASPTPSTAPLSSPTPGDVFEVEAWVDNPTPARDERITASGSLIKNGVYLGGMMMRGTWPEEDQERGVPNCFVLVIYQRGVCTIEVKDYPSGVYVPITVSFEYNSKTYTGQTGFTPR